MQTAQGWAIEEFREASFRDPRVRTRLMDMAAGVARWPAGRVTEVFASSAARQGAYGLLESSSVAPDQVAAGVFAACANRSAKHEFVFVPVDGSSLRLVDHASAKDFGSVGSHKNKARGLKVMNAMALSPEGVPLGLTAQRWWTRPHRRRRKHRDRRPPEQKEINHWLEAIRQTTKVMATTAPGTRCWFQLDREGDAWPTLVELQDAGQHWFTVRSGQNRHVVLGSGRKTKLRDALATLPVQDTFEMEVRPSRARQGRTGKFSIRACALSLALRDKHRGRRFEMQVNVVRVRESGTTPRNEKPIEWILLTNHSVSTRRDLRLVVRGYSMRWRIEEMHRAWKSGCRVEETQLRSTQAVIKWATISAAVAVRIERIKQLSRETPSRPATDEFSDEEIRAAALLLFEEKADRHLPEGTIPSIQQVTHWIAQIGGYTGKSSGGPPGSITISRGLMQVRAAAKALKALRQ